MNLTPVFKYLNTKIQSSKSFHYKLKNSIFAVRKIKLSQIK